MIKGKKNVFFILIIFLISLQSSAGSNKELLGNLSKEEILENFPDWEELVSAYLPKAEVVQKLKAINHEIKVEVYLGTWCPDSKEHVSAYFKLMEVVENPFILTSYIGIPKTKEERKPYIEGKNIEKVPTFILYENNQEIGRIIEHPRKSVEEDFLEIIEANN